VDLRVFAPYVVDRVYSRDGEIEMTRETVVPSRVVLLTRPTLLWRYC
jgi:hypothetical protein